MYTVLVFCCAVFSRIWLFVTPMDCSPPGPSVHGDSPGKNSGVGCHALLQGTFPAQGSNPGLLHCGLILYLLSHQGSSKILRWVAYPFSREFSGDPRIQLGSPALQADSSPAVLPALTICQMLSYKLYAYYLLKPHNIWCGCYSYPYFIDVKTQD